MPSLSGTSGQDPSAVSPMMQRYITATTGNPYSVQNDKIDFETKQAQRSLAQSMLGSTTATPASNPMIDGPPSSVFDPGTSTMSNMTPPQRHAIPSLATGANIPPRGGGAYSSDDTSGGMAVNPANPMSGLMNLPGMNNPQAQSQLATAYGPQIITNLVNRSLEPPKTYMVNGKPQSMTYPMYMASFGRGENPIAAGEAQVPSPTPFQNDLGSIAKPGSPLYNNIMAQKLQKDTYVPEMDPLKRQETQASIVQKGTQANFEKARTDLMNQTGLDDQSIEYRAQMGASGDMDGAYKGLPNSIYGSRARTLITQRMAELGTANGGNGATQSSNNASFVANRAGLRTAATQGAKMDTLSTEVNQFAQQALETSRKVNRTNFVPLTKAEQMVESGTSDPDLADFVAANTSLVNAYSAVANRGTPTVSGQAHAYQMLSTAMGQDAYEKVVNRLLKETAAAKASPGVTMQDIRTRMNGQGAQQPAQPQAVPPGTPSATGPNGDKIYYLNGKWQ